uniref:Uncharacterized protein n=1 Tax=Oryza rufipogon TaxID=4529 RepID=A0A0E0R266_ORYRU
MADKVRGSCSSRRPPRRGVRSSLQLQTSRLGSSPLAGFQKHCMQIKISNRTYIDGKWQISLEKPKQKNCALFSSIREMAGHGNLPSKDTETAVA